MEALTSVSTLIQEGGWLLILLIVLWTGYKGYWVWGSQLKAAQDERDQWQARADKWQEVAFKSTNTAERAVDLATTPKQQGTG